MRMPNSRLVYGQPIQLLHESDYLVAERYAPPPCAVRLPWATS